MNDVKYWIWLTMVFGIASRRLWQLMSVFETAEEAYYELCSDGRLLNLTANEKRNIKTYSLIGVEEIISNCENKGIEMVCYSSEKYPNQLKYILNPPAVLYYKGNIDCLIGTKTITAVGARSASAYSINVTKRICSELAANGIIIVSGFALGTDINAHMAAVAENMPTACVMGCGIDNDYPKGNSIYRDKIIKAGGVLISEYRPETSVAKGNFSARNRILSALGRATVIFEASAKSVALITADYAAEQGREIFSLPPADIFSDAYAGNVELLRNGALPVFGAEEILAYFSLGTPIMSEIQADKFSAMKSDKNHKSKVSTEK
ncbi:MAG: DNA-processing protein DprA, partial [Ruminococcus sp.]|nr:DNA-processing protein DprA [Ruminococcus sp.]